MVWDEWVCGVDTIKPQAPNVQGVEYLSNALQRFILLFGRDITYLPPIPNIAPEVDIFELRCNGRSVFILGELGESDFTHDAVWLVAALS